VSVIAAASAKPAYSSGLGSSTNAGGGQYGSSSGGYGASGGNVAAFGGAGEPWAGLVAPGLNTSGASDSTRRLSGSGVNTSGTTHGSHLSTRRASSGGAGGGAALDDSGLFDGADIESLMAAYDSRPEGVADNRSVAGGYGGSYAGGYAAAGSTYSGGAGGGYAAGPAGSRPGPSYNRNNYGGGGGGGSGAGMAGNRQLPALPGVGGSAARSVGSVASAASSSASAYAAHGAAALASNAMDLGSTSADERRRVLGAREAADAQAAQQVADAVNGEAAYAGDYDALLAANPQLRPLMERAFSLNASVFGHHAFRGRQREVVASALAGHDVFVLMPTGEQGLRARAARTGWRVRI
jgi:hypothetical protein